MDLVYLVLGTCPVPSTETLGLNISKKPPKGTAGPFPSGYSTDIYLYSK